MPETRTQARAHAKRVGIPVANVVKAKKGGHYIAPRGVTSAKGKHAYADCRAGGGKQSTCAAISHNVDSKHRRR